MRKGLPKILTAAVSVILAAGLFLAGGKILEENYVLWNGSLFPRDARSLSITGKRMRRPEAFLRFTDLQQLDARDTGMTPGQYEWFRRELPDCRVLWDIPVQGSYYDPQTTELHVQALAEEEMDALTYLPNLKLLDVGSWEDYPRIRALQEAYPHCTVRYRVNIAGEQWDSDAVSLLLEDADVQELMEKLVWFEKLESVLLTGRVPDQAELQQLQRQYPEVFFLWKMDAMGMTLETDLETLDLTGVALDNAREVEQLLPYFPKLNLVLLNGYCLPQEELVALAARYPQIRFTFELVFGDYVLRTDMEEIDISNTPLESTAQVEEFLPCFHNLKKVVMCQCGIPSEEMDALNQKYENIRFVWSVDLAGMQLRTDAVYFTPNKWGISCDDENIYDLRYCTDMICVDIGHHVKVRNCEWVRYMPDLKYLIIAETGISDLSPLENHESLIYLELFLSKVKDYSPLVTCRKLEDLNLCYTQGDAKSIGEMTWLKRLWWSGSWAGRKYLEDKLPDTYKEFLSISSTGRGWREGQNYYDMRDFIGMDYMVG